MRHNSNYSLSLTGSHAHRKNTCSQTMTCFAILFANYDSRPIATILFDTLYRDTLYRDTRGVEH